MHGTLNEKNSAACGLNSAELEYSPMMGCYKHCQERDSVI